MSEAWPEVGDIVYESFCPQRPGIITAVVKKHKDDIWFDYVQVIWDTKNPKTTTIQRHLLKKLDNLIEEHQKKLEGHIKRYKRAQELRKKLKIPAGK